MHFTRQAVAVIISEKNVISKPVIIAPIMLVAANSIARRIIEIKIAPRIPVKRTDRIGQKQFLKPFLRVVADAIRVIARYKTAIPKTTHKNGAVTVITAMKRRNAAIIPINILVIIAIPTQSLLQSQLRLAILITSSYNICSNFLSCEL